MGKKLENLMDNYGLLGKHIDYSFSRSYFTKKFETLNIDATYSNFDIDDISLFPTIVKNVKNLKGLNVTIPYKETIIPYLDELSKRAKKIGAVNTIKITKKGKLIGYNTDYTGFKKSIGPLLEKQHQKALILGTGGASKAIVHVLNKLNIGHKFVSRSASKKAKYTYSSLTADVLNKHHIIINCTPLGTFPNVSDFPQIPYHAITEKHLLFDLIYNPPETVFLKKGKAQGAKVSNGELMLKLQAEKAWKIWQ